MHTCMHTYIHTFLYAYTHTYIHTSTHIHIHTQTHAYTQTVDNNGCLTTPQAYHKERPHSGGPTGRSMAVERTLSISY